MGANALQPWYARKNSASPERQPLSPQSPVETPGLTLLLKDDSKAKHHSGKRHRKGKSKERQKDKKHSKKRAVEKTGGSVFAALRAEREAREASERKRANQAVLDATFNADG